MRLLRVQVPEFRALKDVDISFEPDFSPQVFPLGSLNGGGKSTLLQLIFVLLSCSAHKEKHQFIANLLDGVTIAKGETSRLFAHFELQDGEEKFELDFIICNDNYLKQLDIDAVFNKEMASFEVIAKENELSFELELLIKENSNMEDEEIFDNYGKAIDIIPASYFIERNDKQIKAIEKYLKNITPLVKNITDIFELKKQIYIATTIYDSIGILCDFSKTGDNLIGLNKKLNDISNNIFLSAPPNQIYLFLDKKDKSLFFINAKGKDSYESKLNTAKNQLSNFITYDVFSIEIIITLFENARNKDFKILVETGEHGNSYKTLIDELSLFIDKIVCPQVDDNLKITGIIFKSNEGKELYPEDLSHGELKRLSIYVWLKTMQEKENIILMDEVENGFHPDWQYSIVGDLIEWGKNNQYILATHSYELCTAVTPAHVKELTPQLIKK